MSRFEVTQAQFKKVTGRTPSYFVARAGGGRVIGAGVNPDRCPVECVTWYDAVEYCILLSKQEKVAPYYDLTAIKRNAHRQNILSAECRVLGGRGYRLPTEAEWEYACRAGTITHFYFGDTSNGTKANVDGTQPFGTTVDGPFLQHTTEVGSYRLQNALGLHDSCGNVWEWCEDSYDAKAYQRRPKVTVDPRAFDNKSELRVLRGGAGDNPPIAGRSSCRNRSTPDHVNNFVGFRPARFLQ
jgi:formylglycine-generating enzyme required for sulfatase activity